jgi:predicted nucleic acid-binding protein
MTHYLDASALVSMFCADAHTPAVRRLLHGAERLLVSDFAAAEFASAVARLHRTDLLDRDEAEAIFGGFDLWNASRTLRIEALPADMAAAAMLVRRLALGLRAPDALNLAIAQRARAILVTFDLRMAAAARSLGVPVAAA